MIIQCQACLARFKLDPSRIKGKGARIRCRKCSEAIIVMKSDFPPPEASPPVEKDQFDLGAILRKSEATSPTPTRGEVDTAIGGIPHRERETDQVTTLRVEGPAPPTEREQEVLGQEPAEQPTEQTPALRDEVDASFESPALSEEETEQAPPPPMEDPIPPEETEREVLGQVPAEPTAEQTPALRDEVDASFESPPLSEEETEQAPSLPEEEPPAEKEALDLRSVLYDPEEKTAAPSHDEPPLCRRKNHPQKRRPQTSDRSSTIPKKRLLHRHTTRSTPPSKAPRLAKKRPSRPRLPRRKIQRLLSFFWMILFPWIWERKRRSHFLRSRESPSGGHRKMQARKASRSPRRPRRNAYRGRSRKGFFTSTPPFPIF
jgi:predicted Zn finger-like uncharacterized protein